ncbi:MAG: hypothetical protein E5V28_19955 [Mesorhizobium sp.]|nr:MAG: hypothetical protein E5V28_19955 [Mesorhizobium sp.]
MKSGQVLRLLVAALFVLIAGSASAQTRYTLSVVAKGTFTLDNDYPGSDKKLHLLNFHWMLRGPKSGEGVNYFIFKPSIDIFKEMKKSFEKSYLFSTIKPCSRGIDQDTADRAQMIAGRIVPIEGRVDLLPYIEEEKFIRTDDYVYIAVDANLRNYVRSENDHGYEWVAAAVKRKQLCMDLGVIGHMLQGVTSDPVNISSLADFVFVD